MKFLKFIGFCVLLFGLFAFGYAWRDISRGSLPNGETMGALLNAKPKRAAIAPNQMFSEAYSTILAGYYKEFDGRSLKYAGMEGLMASLGDPHTMFMEPKETQAFAMETSANFVGVGARLSPDPAGAKIAVVFDDGPAQKIGLKVGDLITNVDGAPMAGEDIGEIVSRIRGKAGTRVTITVVRDGVKKPLEFKPTRAKIIIPTVESAMIPGTKFGRIAVSQFAEPTADQFDRAMQTLAGDGMKGLVVDLRGNPGGLLETAVEMLSRFASDKVVVRMKGRGEREEVAKTYVGMAKAWPFPIVVLVNEDSASASEIFAGCMRDYRLATIVGEHTYGKASVQNVRMLVDGASAKITIARYFLPSTGDISRKVDEDGQYVSGGLKPDVTIELDPEKTTVFGEIAKDAQLAKAVEVLKSKV